MSNEEEYDDDEEESYEEEMEEADPDLHEFVLGRNKITVKLEDFVSVTIYHC